MREASVLICMIARIPADGIAAFAAYEARVLPLLATCGGVLERRVATTGRTVELHLVGFGSQADLERFRALPERLAAQALLIESGAAIETFVVADV